MAEWIAIAKLHGDVGPSMYPYTRTPKDGFHVYFRRLEGMVASDCRGNLPPGIDVRGAGYTIAPGSVMPDGRMYAPVDGSPLLSLDISEAPRWLVEMIGATKPRDQHSAEPVVPWDGDIETALAIEALEADDGAFEGDGGNLATYTMACRLRALSVSEARCFELMSGDWNDRCSPPWSLDELEVIVGNAYRYGQGAPGERSPRHDFDGVQPLPSGRAPLTSLDERLMRQGDALPRRPWLLKHLLPRTGTALLVAPSGAGKSSVAGQLAKCLATGTDFFGTSVKERCGTLILAAEGSGGLQARLNVLSLDGGLPIYALRLATLNGEAAFNAMLADVKEVAALCLAEHGMRLALVIVDTLAASGLIINENDNSECAAAIKKLQRLSEDGERLVMATHHSPKVGTDPRGGSALAAGVDVILTVLRNGHAQVRAIHCTKGRDSREGTLGSFTLLVETVGMDEDGDIITACAVSMSDPPLPGEIGPSRVPPTSRQIAEIQERIDEGAPDGLPWRFAYSSHDDGDNWAGVPIGEVMQFVAQGVEGRVLAQMILNEMIKGGSVIKGGRTDPSAPKNAQRKSVPFVKLPELCATLSAPWRTSANLPQTSAPPPTPL